MNLQQARYYTKRLFSTNWVKWIHKGTKPAETNLEKAAYVLGEALSNHCAICLNLNGCCFVKEKCSKFPLHQNCHCHTIDIPAIAATAECPIEKFKYYVFAGGKGKKQLFELWGYSIMDSEYLKQEFERQAKPAYSVGDYELGLLDKYGQRISVTITLKRKDKNENVFFLSGWMVYPNGSIKLTTPYGGK